MKNLKLGILGMSDGNGHPYSWSAIFNGYDHEEMEGCGFPVIPRYLEKQKFPQDLIHDARVTHVWTQDKMLSKKIAKSSLIDNIVDDFEELIGEVDAILLARDDAENHFKYASPFLAAGLPIYIDKPLALNKESAARLLAQQKFPGQIFSCSAFRFAKEINHRYVDFGALGKIKSIHAIGPKSWAKYAIHLIEPVLALLPERGPLVYAKSFHGESSTTLVVEYGCGTEILVSTLGDVVVPITLRIIGTAGYKDIFFEDTFFAFKETLNKFILSVRSRDPEISVSSMFDVVDLIERGLRNG